MGWEKVDGQNYAGRQDTVRFAVAKNNRAQHRICAYVFIGRNVCKKLGWTKDTRLDAYWGTGKNEGSIRLEEAMKGRYVLRCDTGRETNSRSLYIGVSYLPSWASKQVHGRDVAVHVALDKMLDVTCPAWFVGKKLRVVEKAA